MLEVYGIKGINKIPKGVITKMLGLVSQQKRDRVKKFIHTEDKARSLVGELLVKNIVYHNLGLTDNQISFKKNDYGKPFLAGYPDFQFNISHSGDWVVCAVDEEPVGVDIEQVKPIDYKIAESFFSRQEYKDLMQKKDTDYFYKLWTLKESYIKALGKGLSIPLDSFTVQVDKGKINFSAKADYPQRKFQQFFLADNYILSICSSTEKTIEKIIISNQNEFLEKLAGDINGEG